MSTYTGRQQKGAARAHRDARKTEAEARQKRFATRVLRRAIDAKVTEDEARRMLRLEGTVLHQLAGGAL